MHPMESMQDPREPIMAFTKPLVPGKLAAAGIVPPSDPSPMNGGSGHTFTFHGRMGRGGRLIFDRRTPFMHTSFDTGN